MIKADIVLDSVSEAGIRLTTIAVQFPKFLNAEINTHRMLSRSYASSRAIPVAETLRRVQEEPFIPTYWGKNERGMQATEECSELVEVNYTRDNKKWYDREDAWLDAAGNATQSAYHFHKAGYHKQLVNRLLEPFSYVTGIITATEWDNFLALRLHPDAQPEFQELAKAMKDALDNSTPTVLEAGEWHLPYVTQEDERTLMGMPSGGEGNLAWVGETLKKLSVARCARASFASNQRQQTFTVEQDIALYSRLSGPPEHAGPREHQGTPMVAVNANSIEEDSWQHGITHMDRAGDYWSANFRGWLQGRHTF